MAQKRTVPAKNIPRKPIEVLKKGLAVLTKTVKAQKDKLTAKLSRKEALSTAEEQWLDEEGNVIDEQYLVDTLEAASDYEKGIEELDERGKGIVKKLRELAGDLPKVPGNKRKRSEYEVSFKAPKQNTVREPPKPVFTKKEFATLAQRIEILDWYHKRSGKNQTKTARHFAEIYPNLCLTQPLVSSWIKDEARWREQWANATHGSDRSAKRVRQTEHPEVTEMMDLWIAQTQNIKLLLHGDALRKKWNDFADLVGVPQDERLKLSNGWLECLKRRHGLREFKRHGEAASAAPETIEEERLRIQKLIKESGYQLSEIYNMDETGLFYGLVPDRGLSSSKHAGVKGRKVRLTYALTSNADGSRKLPPLIIGKALRPRAFNKKTAEYLGFEYRANANAWMTTDFYQDWIQKWDRQLDAKKERALLLQDNFSGHHPPAGLKCIRVENFSPNLTAHIQPNDQGIIRCFKAHYRSKFIQRALNRYDAGVTPAEIYEINQLEAMRLADAAWREVDTTTIRNCWNKAAILPKDMPEIGLAATPQIPISALVHDAETQVNPVLNAEQHVESVLDGLEDRGVLQRCNRMDIEELVNPPLEEIIMEASDIEIYHAVIEAVKARDNIEANGGDDVDDVGPIEPVPTYREVLQAATLINRFANEINDPFARKLEALLGTFSRQLRLTETRNLRGTVLTDYFELNRTRKTIE